ncbi:putative fungal zinc cluster transcription factor [Pseudozyma hubeiensis]|nr:putative fungal zinc cluster transcription factor [Pseudozyma hubeiensis]
MSSSQPNQHSRHQSHHGQTSRPSSDEERERLEALWKPQQVALANPTLKPHRHLHIDWPNATIKKTLAIGASAPDTKPPVYDRPLLSDEENNASSCVLVTKSSPINATVYVLKESAPPSSETSSSTPKKADKPILISAKTGSVGSISLTIPSYIGSRPLNIRAKSVNGNIVIYLPESFSGLLNWTSETGTLKLSPAVQQRFKCLDSPPHKHKGTAKIVPSTASGLRGDVCTITNRHGSIYIREAQEEGRGAADGEKDKSCVIQ